ncbi:hypothetical protein H8M03_04395 [Sphingomonas sabuli]|uniref:YtxH domain-containing protein n=1 Tax=Sphingomonas sabuli TaxID=2764186 RepID=A0A7G9L4M4_9SPHN|nr:hypothetical protein [Sphingomonas sabuli]QNM83573.1 hypothetical protein H8M03_04395 [Sphingomonas sabuli]
MTDFDNTNRTDGRTTPNQGVAGDVRERAIDAYDSALDTASSAAAKTNEAIETAPLIALGAGIAAGALIAALIPASRRERELLKPYGDRVTGAAKGAARAARETGTEKLRELGLTPDNIADKASEAAKATAQAAVGQFKDKAGSNR